MIKFLAVTMACVCCFSACTITKAAEEKTEIKQNKDGSWKMKIKRKGDKEYVGTYEGKTYTLRGENFGPNFRDDSEYTVYGTIAPDNTYITTSRVEPYETRETVTTTTTDDSNWRMRVARRGDKEWVGVVGDKTYVLRGDAVREEGEYTVHGKMHPDGYITTTRVERFQK